MGLHVLAAIVAQILGSWPPEHVVEIRMAYGIPMIVDTSCPRDLVYAMDPRSIFTTRFRLDGDAAIG